MVSQLPVGEPHEAQALRISVLLAQMLTAATRIARPLL